MALIIHESHIQCDGCGLPFGQNETYRPPMRHRKNAAKEGWTQVNKEDYCKQCSETKSDDISNEEVKAGESESAPIDPSADQRN